MVKIKVLTNILITWIYVKSIECFTKNILYFNYFNMSEVKKQNFIIIVVYYFRLL